MLCISYKKGGIEEIKSARIDFFSLIDYIYLTYRYNLDEYMIVLIQKHNTNYKLLNLNMRLTHLGGGESKSESESESSESLESSTAAVPSSSSCSSSELHGGL